MEKETYNRLLGERMNEIQEISKETDLNNLTYYFKTSDISLINFIKFDGPFGFFKEIKNGNVSLKKAESEKENKFKSNFGEITSGNPRRKEKYQLDTIKNVKNLYDSRQKNIDLFNNSAKIRSEAIHKTKQNGTGLKILIPKQMLQRLPIAVAQVKAENNLESLLNEINQIVYYTWKNIKSSYNKNKFKILAPNKIENRITLKIKDG